MTKTEPRVYIACLSCYTSSRLEGVWLDADELLCDSFEEWRLEHCSKFGNHEEFLVHDTEGFDGYNLGEVSVPEAQEIGAFVTEHGDSAIAALQLFDTFKDAEKALEDNYQGEHDSLEAWAEDWMESTGSLQNVPENLRYYFDFEKYARDCELSGDISSVEVNGKIHVFGN